jgi:hypothetical protein
MKFKEINILAANIQAVIGNQETKVQKKLAKIYEKLDKYGKMYDEKLADLRLDYAATDDKGVLLLNEKGGYTFKKEDLKKLNEKVRALNEEEFVLDPINIVNPEGLQEFTFLKEWTKGIEFINEEEL